MRERLSQRKGVTDMARKDWREPAQTLEQILAEVDGYDERDMGKLGKKYEPAFRLWLMGELERCHPQGVTDIAVKSGVALEVGHRCKALTPLVFNSAEEALEYWNNTKMPMRNATHIAYSPTGTMGNFPDTRIYTQREFINILTSCGLIRAKSDKGLYKVAIQTFYNSTKRNNQFIEALNQAGETPHEFIERMFA